jgi:hypothetical protein
MNHLMEIVYFWLPYKIHRTEVDKGLEFREKQRFQNT